MRHNDQTTTKPPKIESIKNPLLLVSQGIADFIQVVDDTGLEFARRPYQALPARTKQYQKALCYKGLGRSVVPTRTKAKQPVTTY